MDAIEFLKRAAEAAERLNRHPDVELHYVNLAPRLTTHNASNKVTKKDLRLAGETQKAVEEFREMLAQWPRLRNSPPLSSAAAESLYPTNGVRL